MFGVVMEVKIYRKGSYGFVQFERHEDAVRAIVNMNGGNLGGRALKCSWGRHQARPSKRAPFLKIRLCDLGKGNAIEGNLSGRALKCSWGCHQARPSKRAVLLKMWL